MALVNHRRSGMDNPQPHDYSLRLQEAHDAAVRITNEAIAKALVKSMRDR